MTQRGEFLQDAYILPQVEKALEKVNVGDLESISRSLTFRNLLEGDNLELKAAQQAQTYLIVHKGDSLGRYGFPTDMVRFIRYYNAALEALRSPKTTD